MEMGFLSLSTQWVWVWNDECFLACTSFEGCCEIGRGNRQWECVLFGVSCEWPVNSFLGNYYQKKWCRTQKNSEVRQDFAGVCEEVCQDFAGVCEAVRQDFAVFIV